MISLKDKYCQIVRLDYKKIQILYILLVKDTPKT